MKKYILFLSIIFILFSFSPSFYEIYRAKNIPPERVFVLEHNFMFDYNFYLSRIREGQEGRWLVSEKYYNQPHKGSLFQIVYLFMGKIGGWLGLSPPWIYHLGRIGFGFFLLVLTGFFIISLFPKSVWWQISAFLFTITCGSWPILMKIRDTWRFATYMGWWSAVDSLARITFIPHVLLGQIFILIFIWKFGEGFKSFKVFKLIIWGILGLIAGIIFPPTLVVVYTVFAVLTLLEFISLKRSTSMAGWFKERVVSKGVFFLFSFPSFVYLQLMFKIWPWKALALFDIEHRMPLPYKEYILALGPVLWLGIAGGIVALVKKEKRLLSSVSWIIALGLLIIVFEKVPQQSPLRFTEAVINIPLGILAAYLFYFLYQASNKCKRSLAFVIRGMIGVVTVSIIIMGLGVMWSMVLWLTDQGKAKGEATWPVPIGAQLAYPLKDFMDGIFFLRDQTKKEEVVLAYVTAGNFIPAYAGNFVYLGHANTPNENEKEKIAALFFAGKMNAGEAKEFLTKERISYIFFGPQEREWGGVADLSKVYPYIWPVYSNKQVVIYKVK